MRYSPISARRVCRPRSACSCDATLVDSDWAVRRDDEGADEDEATSRSRCSTPISSASSASIDVGICVNVRCVVVPSCAKGSALSPYFDLLRQAGQGEKEKRSTHIADLLDGKVGIGGDTRISSSTTSPHIDNDHDWPGAETFKQLGDFQIGRTESGTGMVESDRLLLCYTGRSVQYRDGNHAGPSGATTLHGQSLTVDLSEHPPHFLDIIQIQEKRLWITLVLFKRYRKAVKFSSSSLQRTTNVRESSRVGDVYRGPVILTQQDTQYTLFVG